MKESASAVYRKRLEGIAPFDELEGLLQSAMAKESTRPVVGDVSSPTSTATHLELDHPNAQRNQQQIIDCRRSMALDTARTVLGDFQQKHNDSTTGTAIPLAVIRALEQLLDAEGRAVLTKSLQTTQLVYTPPPPLPEQDDDPEKLKFRKRMARLRLKNEESKYTKLTSNLHLEGPSDDITTRSMTYAASIGLNMIVAPLSFGCFMFFFAGGLLDYFFPSPTTAHSGPDIKRVIIGVVSGVAMLFIEMILFVIRTHEMEKVMAKKAKKKKPQPFGHYSSRTSKTYKDE